MSDKEQNSESMSESRLERARAFSGKVRKVYKSAYDKAVGVGKDRLDEFVKASEDIEPKLRSAIDDKIQSANAIIDSLNQSLADKTIPKIRRKSVSSEECQDSQDK
jgi:hypothetical protein